MATRKPSYGSDARPVGDSEALYQFRLLEALRSGDIAKIHPFLNDLTKPGADEEAAGSLLSRAIKCASYETVEHILLNRSVDPNKAYPTSSGTTPLHLAGESGRADIVRLLLQQPTIDDTLIDGRGLSCVESASSPEVVETILESRSNLQTHFLHQLSLYINSPLSNASPTVRSHPSTSTLGGGGRPSLHQTPSNFSAHNQVAANPSSEILKILKSPRAAILDLNALDQTTGTTLLHEAVRRKDLAVIRELALERGADVFVRNRQGKRAFDGEKGVGAGDDVSNLLKQASNNQKAMLTGKTDGKLGVQRGYLMKYTNVAHGYKSRWFVLDNGTLSYFRNQEEENKACRGSVHLKFAQIKATSSTGFDVSSSGSDSRFPRYSLKASHPQEAANWSQSIKLHIDFARTGGLLDSSASSIHSKRTSNQFRRPLTRSPSTAEISLPDPINVSKPIIGVTSPLVSTQRLPSPSRSIEDDNQTLDGDDDLNPIGNSKSIHHVHLPGLPHEDKYELLAHSTREHIDVTNQLLDALVVATPSPAPSIVNSTSSSSAPLARTLSSTSSRQQTVKDSIRHSLKVLSDLIVEYQGMSMDREKWLIARYQHEVDAKLLWEESMQDVARQQADMEKDLQEASMTNSRQRKELRAARLMSPGGTALLEEGGEYPTSSRRGSLLRGTVVGQGDVFGGGGAGVPGSGESSTTQVTTPSAPSKGLPSIPPPSSSSDTPLDPSHPSVTITLPPPPILSHHVHTLSSSRRSPHVAGTPQEEEDEDEDDDEFFDAIEQGTLPLQIASFIEAGPSPDDGETPRAEVSERETALGSKLEMEEEYEPYSKLRKRLPISSDAKPPVSLWTILKSSIGKDLTKISFPVFFNEPTSMLQRMAEDMEYSECLDAASAEPDSLKRLAYVAAFAMSNYSSTSGRIAKPFNPMLGETFEYARLDKKFRYVSEQVCHHPPISACWSESPHFRYYGEVDAKNKFLGRSFEIRPTGVAHVDLRIPSSFVAKGKEYPDDEVYKALGQDGVLEHYSWKKVTTAVSNFIMGNPIIDHYGDMIVTNHRTGETCTLSFKPRGWRAKDSAEVKGVVQDAQGRVEWDIAGRWTSQLVARKSGAGHGLLGADDDLPTTNRGGSLSPHIAPEYILLWRNTPKPAAPFNLSPFAVTLNDVPAGLMERLPATDCRLRPDQKAFENAQYERANDLKNAQEAKQRETRRKREIGELPPHEPRWFTRSTDSDTSEQVWEPRRSAKGEVEYWSERARVKKEGDGWKKVENIFVNEEGK
ncbi:Oxysterol-binding protein-domain-containing protein [Mrakia frigida]|uniref:oxysterol-binding protein related protein SWH1 n=1 Tax=Mrakia frigida TaxID=29902 RepID=UPI003FCC1D11